MTTQYWHQLRTTNVDMSYDTLTRKFTFREIVCPVISVSTPLTLGTATIVTLNATTLNATTVVAGTYYGSTASGGSSRLDSTSHATPGMIYFGGGILDYYDEATGVWNQSAISTRSGASYSITINGSTVITNTDLAGILFNNAVGGGYLLGQIVGGTDDEFYYGHVSIKTTRTGFANQLTEKMRIDRGGVVRITSEDVPTTSPVDCFQLFSKDASALAGASTLHIRSERGGNKIVNAFGSETAAANTPTAASWTPGDIVQFVDSTDATANGLWMLKTNGTDWNQIDTNSSIRNVKDYGAIGDGTANDTVALQAAMDAGTGVLRFPRGIYKVTGAGAQALLLTKKVCLIADDPERTYIRGDGLGAGTSLLKVAFSDNSGMTDVRNWKIDGLGLYCNASGKHALLFEGGFPLYTSAIRNCTLTGYATNSGYSIYIDKGDFGHNLVELNNCSPGIYCADIGDANVFSKNMIFGTGRGITVDMVYGVCNNTFRDNTIVTREGAFYLINGDQVVFENNQCEQALGYTPSYNLSTPSAQVYLEGAGRAVESCVIRNNNFGGGTNVNYLIYIDNAHHTTIESNRMIACGGWYGGGTIGIVNGVVTISVGEVIPLWAADANLYVLGGVYSIATRDSDTQLTLDNLTVNVAPGTVYSVQYPDADLYLTANAKYTLFHSNNTITDRSPFNPRLRTAFKAEVNDLGVGNAGVLQLAASKLTLANSWTGGDFYKDCEGVVHFYTPFQAGTITATTLMGTLPVGFRPNAAISIPCASAGGAGWLNVAVNGQITVGALVDHDNVMPSSFVSGETE